MRSQNVSIETWIRAAKLNLKIPIHSEDINDMECTGGQKNKKQHQRQHKSVRKKENNVDK